MTSSGSGTDRGRIATRLTLLTLIMIQTSACAIRLNNPATNWLPSNVPLGLGQEPVGQITIQTPIRNGVKVGASDAPAFVLSGTCSEDGQAVSISGAVSGSTSCGSGTWSLTLDLSGQPDGLLSVTASHVGNASVRTLVKDAAFCAANAGGAPFAGGTGSPADPYLLCTQAQLNEVRNQLGSSFSLRDNIDLAGSPNGFAPLGGNGVGTWPPFGQRFTGVFNGNSFEVRNFRYDAFPNNYSVGLFGQVDDGGVIRSLGVTAVSVTGHTAVGGLVGGVFGNVLIEYSYATGLVTAGSGAGVDVGLLVGGLGANPSGVGNNMIRRSFAIGVVDNSIDVACCAGGLLGWMYGSTIQDSYAQVSILPGAVNVEVGGLIGAVNAQASAPSSILRAYAIGPVGGNGGGLVGQDRDGFFTVTDSYWDLETSGQTASEGGTAKTRAEMSDSSMFTGWDFATVWVMPANIGRASDPPELRAP